MTKIGRILLQKSKKKELIYMKLVYLEHIFKKNCKINRFNFSLFSFRPSLEINASERKKIQSGLIDF